MTESLGERVAHYRRQSGKSLRQVAGLAGISAGQLSKIENGTRSLNHRAHVSALAAALGITETELVGMPQPPGNPEQSRAHSCVPAVRLAYLANTLGEQSGRPTRSAAQLDADMRDMLVAREACRYGKVGDMLPGLVNDAHNLYAAEGNSEEGRTALRSLVHVGLGSSLWFKNLGFSELSWIAADRSRQAADALEDEEYKGVAQFALGQALIGLGGHVQAGEGAAAEAEALPTQTPEQLSVYGQMLLTKAHADIVTGEGDGVSLLTEAGEIAERVGYPNAHFLNFSPTGVDLWRLAFAIEKLEPGQAVKVARGVVLETITAQTRLAHYWSDLGRAFAMMGKDADAVHAFVTAEALAPDRIRTNVFVREATREILQRARSQASSPELTGLVTRMGLEG